MGAPSVLSTSGATKTKTGIESVSVKIPVTTSVGDRLLMAWLFSDGTSAGVHTAPAGWTHVGTTTDQAVLYSTRMAASGTAGAETVWRVGGRTTGTGTFAVLAVFEPSTVTVRTGKTVTVTAPTAMTVAIFTVTTASSPRAKTTPVHVWTSHGGPTHVLWTTSVASGAAVKYETASPWVFLYATAPSTAVLLLPKAGSTVTAAHGTWVRAQYVSTDGASANAYAAQLTAKWWTAANASLSTGKVWNTCSILPTASLTVSFPKDIVSNGNTYAWSVEFQEATNDLQGTLAPAISFTTVTGMTVAPTPTASSEPTTFAYRLSSSFAAPYYTTTGATPSTVPPQAPYQVSIAGREYMVDTSFEPYRRTAFRHRSIPSQREAVDLTNEPGEGTINTADLWRRGQENWALGSGQPYLDRKESNPTRFWRSKGIETGYTWQLSLLPKAVKVLSTVHIRSALVAADCVYVAEQKTVKFSKNLATWTTVTGSPSTSTASTVLSMATNGHTVWIAFGKKGIYKTTVGASSMSSYVTGTVDWVGWGAIYLMAANANKLYQIKTSGSLPTTPFYTHPNTKWVWNGIAWGNAEMYLSGYVKGTATAPVSGAIYRTATISTAEPTLSIPVLSLPFETGEYPTAIYAYLNFVFVGTNLGIRMCRTIAAYDPSGNAGDLEAGAIQPNIFQQVAKPVVGITGHNRFIYFTWQTYDTTSAGLGRLDLANFVDELTPAYVTDMMVAKAPLLGCTWFLANPTTSVLSVKNYSSPLLVVTGAGLYANTPSAKVTQGQVDSGYVTFGVPDDKAAMALSLRALSPLQGSMQGLLSVDEPLAENYSGVGRTYPTLPTKQYPVNQLRGEQFQVRCVLFNTGNASPTLSRWLLKAYPCVVAGVQISCVLMLSREIDEQGVNRSFDPYAEYEFLESLRQSQQIVRYVEGPWSRTVIITALDWIPNNEQGNAGDRRGYNADLVVYMKTLPQTSA